MSLTKSSANTTRLSRSIMFEVFTLKSIAVQQKEETLRESIRGLTETERKLFYERFSEKVKDPDTYAVLNFFFVAGLHHFYLHKYMRGSINLLISLYGFIEVFSFEDGQWQGGVGLTLISLIVFIEIPALFRSQLLVKDYNNRLSQKTLLEIKGSSSR